MATKGSPIPLIMSASLCKASLYSLNKRNEINENGLYSVGFNTISFIILLELTINQRSASNYSLNHLPNIQKTVAL